MNKLDRPIFDDFAALQNIGNNDRLDSFPHLRGAAPTISTGYQRYLDAEGNSRAIVQVTLPEIVKGFLKGHYKSPPLALSIIKQTREQTEADLCPMCGSFHTGTLDHFLPKEDYPEYAVFTANLVPACKCNTRRGRAVFGDEEGERFLHPYFDKCLSRRLLQAVIEEPGSTPIISTRLLLNEHDPEYAAASFHHKFIADKTSLHRHLRNRWVKFCRKPSTVIRELRQNPVSRVSLARILIDDIHDLDEELGGKNNWNSIFGVGLLNRPVFDWIWSRLNEPGRGDNDPLV